MKNIKNNLGEKMVRVRFAPSPTGLPHVGNIRTALFNWLFARHHAGKVILRIEDTDRERFEPEALEAIMFGLRWLGLDWDEGPEVGGPFGPYFQSERLDIYHKFARELVKKGKAYYCNCSTERLDRVRNELREKRLPPMYDRLCRELGIDSDPTDPNTVVRLKVPLWGKTSLCDELRGEISFDNSTFDDIVLIKSDSFPTYHFAVVCDDHLMEISHIFRGEEWIPSAGKHVILFNAFGWEIPKMIHLAMILGPDRAKLSKRHGATAITEFVKAGIMPQAMLNFLTLLGWSPKDDTEIFDVEEIIKRFDLNGINTSPSVFDFEKLNWMNSEYIRKLIPSELTKRLKPYYIEWGWLKDDDEISEEYLNRVSKIMQERLRKFTDMKSLGRFFFMEPEEYDPKGVKKNFKPIVADRIVEVAQRFENLEKWDEESIENIVREYAKQLCLGAGKIIHPIRLASSGLRMGPSLFEMLIILGKDKVVKRLRKAAAWIKDNIME